MAPIPVARKVRRRTLGLCIVTDMLERLRQG